MRSTAFHRLPPNILVLFIRFYDQNGANVGGRIAHIEETLDLNVTPLFPTRDQDHVYQLRSIVLHTGATKDQGHYTSILHLF